MKKLFILILIIFIAGVFYVSAEEVGVTPSKLPLTVTTSTDQYGNSINAIEPKGIYDFYIDANASTTGSFAFEGYKTGSTVCLQIDANGLLEVAAAACGTGAGSGDWATTSEAYYWTTVDTDSLAEGTNLYYTDNRVRDYINTSSTIQTHFDYADAAYGWGDWSGEGFIKLTSLSGSSPIDYNNVTGDFSFDFTTANTWSGINTFSSDLRATGGLHATTTDFDMLQVNGNATTTGSMHIGQDLTVLNGRVGIGTTEPDGLLHVYTDDGDMNAYIETADTGTTDDAKLWIKTDNGDAGLLFATDGTTWHVGNYGQGSVDDFVIGVSATVGLGNVMTIKKVTGNIGIGTSTPDSLLTVDGTFAVGTNGTEMTVDADGNVVINGSLTSTSIINSGTATTTELCFADGTCGSTFNPMSNEVLFYFHDEMGAGGYELMLDEGTHGVAEDSDSCAAASGVDGGYCSLGGYISGTSTINTITWPAGTWHFDFYIDVSSAAGISNLILTTFSRTTGGVETQQFQATSSELTIDHAGYYSFDITQPEITTDNPSDRMVVKLLGYTDSASEKIITYYYEGSAHYSHIHTTFRNPIELGNYAQTNIEEIITAPWTFDELLTINNDLVVTGDISATTTLDYWFINTAGIDTDDLSEGSTNLYQDDELTNWINNVILGTNGDMETEGYASSTTGLFTQGTGHIGGDLSVDGIIYAADNEGVVFGDNAGLMVSESGDPEIDFKFEGENGGIIEFLSDSGNIRFNDDLIILEDGSIDMAGNLATPGIIYATSTVFENTTSTHFAITGITGSTQCLTVDTNGTVSGTGAACGAGAGGGIENLNNETLGSIGDVSTTTIAYGSTLTWDTSDWISTSTIYGFGEEWATAYNATSTFSGSLTINGDLTITGNNDYSDLVASDVTDFQAGVWSEINASSTMPIGDWNTAFGWGDHSGAGYYAAADFSADWDSNYNSTTTLSGFTNNQSNWNTAYDWGDHAGLYLLDGESDVMTGTLTADGFTLGSTELLTIGSNLFTHDGTDFTLDDTLAITGYASSTLGLNTQGTMHIGSNGLIEGTLGVIGNIDTEGTYKISGTDLACSDITNCVDNAWDGLTDMALTEHYIYVGNGSADPVGVAMSNDCSIISNGTITCDHNALDNYAADRHIDWKAAGADTIHTDHYIENPFGVSIGDDDMDLTDSFAWTGINTGTNLSLTYSTTTGTMTIPQGAAPVVGLIGNIALDTTKDQLIVFGSSAKVIQTEVRIWGVTVASTSPAFISEGLLPAPDQLDGYTITRITCKAIDGTSKIIAIEDAGTNSSENITCDTNGATDDGSITNATYTAGEFSNIDFGATDGAVNYVSISVFGIWLRE